MRLEYIHCVVFCHRFSLVSEILILVERDPAAKWCPPRPPWSISPTSAFRKSSKPGPNPSRWSACSVLLTKSYSYTCHFLGLSYCTAAAPPVRPIHTSPPLDTQAFRAPPLFPWFSYCCRSRHKRRFMCRNHINRPYPPWLLPDYHYGNCTR